MEYQIVRSKWKQHITRDNNLIRKQKNDLRLELIVPIKILNRKLVNYAMGWLVAAKNTR